MDFFEAQDKARETTRRLIVIYILVAALIVALVTFATVAVFVYFPEIFGHAFGSRQAKTLDAAMYSAVPKEVFIGVASFIAVFILAGTLFRSANLLKGGGKVATALGGTQLLAGITDPAARRLRNVVEEMAIASGIPVPDIYVLEEEGSINAFAAGFTPGDATVTVTRGALELLDRDELQGIIAHEFSHILNGDMRLNIRLMGLLFGITAIHTVGRGIMIGGFHMFKGTGMVSLGFGSAADKVGATDSKILGWAVALALLFFLFILMISVSIMFFGVVLALLGVLGVFSARTIKSAISRQREYLADASAIQFTRQTAGIAGALKKIGGHREMSYITVADPEEISHMLFGRGSKSAGTHPPLTDRIRALDPGFDAESYPDVEPVHTQQIATEEEAAGQRTADIASTPGSGAAETAAIVPESIIESVAKPGRIHIDYAQRLRQSIPENLYAAAHSVESSYTLTLALILDRSGQHLERQMILVEEHIGSQASSLVRSAHAELAKIGAVYRLPLLGLAFPALKRRPPARLVELTGLTQRLAEIDGDVDLYEFCFGRILRLNLRHALNPSGNVARTKRIAKRSALINVLAIVAQYGHKDPAEGQAALNAGKELLGEWADKVTFDVNLKVSVAVLDQSLDVLLGLNCRDLRTLLLAIGTVAAHDKRLNAGESDLIRAIYATLDCPLPPILFENT